jgi:hypothetical protein
MSVLHIPRARADGKRGAARPERALPLITEQELLLSTSAAKALRYAPTRRWGDAPLAIVATLRRAFVTATASPRPVRRDCASRLPYFEDARMAREMDRL